MKHSKQNMKLKTRLTIASLLVVLVPVIMVLAAFLCIGTMKIRRLERDYGITFSMEYLFNSARAASDATNEIYEQMKADRDEDPDRFLSFTYLQKTNAELEKRFSFLIVLKEDEVFYSGTERELNELLPELRRQSQQDTISENGTNLGTSMPVIAKQLDLVFSDGSTGSANVITVSSELQTPLRSLIRQMLIVIMLVMTLTAICVAFWIYRGISIPIGRLREATNRIASGDLDFTVDTEGEDEISDLCRDFEKMRKRLQQSEEEKRKYDTENKELISNISHDLKTPITTVKGYVEGIMDGVADTPEKMDHYIRTIYNKANEMDRLINELTFYSKIDTNRIPYAFTRLNVKDYFDDCAEEVNIDLQEKGIAFTYDNKVDADTRIIADPEQLTRVINNIISNAVKYMDKPEKKVDLRVRDAGDFIQVEIEDNGKGIAPKDLPNIFDRFYRTDASRNSSQGGSGIGLSIVRKIIEDHSGRIWATSRPGRGTTLIFVIRKHIRDVEGEKT